MDTSCTGSSGFTERTKKKTQATTLTHCKFKLIKLQLEFLFLSRLPIPLGYTPQQLWIPSSPAALALVALQLLNHCPECLLLSSIANPLILGSCQEATLLLHVQTRSLETQSYQWITTTSLPTKEKPSLYEPVLALSSLLQHRSPLLPWTTKDSISWW